MLRLGCGHKLVLMFLLSSFISEVVVLLRFLLDHRFWLNSSLRRYVLSGFTIFNDDRFLYHVDVVIILNRSHILIIILLEVIMVLLMRSLLVVKHVCIWLKWDTFTSNIIGFGYLLWNLSLHFLESRHLILFLIV